MPSCPSDPLTRQELIEVFKLATKGLVILYGNQFESGMGDAELKSALEQVLGIFGGSGGPDRLSVCFKGSGLYIWGDRQSFNHVKAIPLFKGTATIAMAREVYGIADPNLEQLPLL